jgi:hypothetical protein
MGISKGQRQKIEGKGDQELNSNCFVNMRGPSAHAQTNKLRLIAAKPNKSDQLIQSADGAPTV